MGKRKNKKKQKMLETVIAIIILAILALIGVNYEQITEVLEKNNVIQTSSQNNIEEKNVAETDEKDSSVKQKENETSYTDGELKIYFFDVGQADSILLINGNQTMLIDAGTNEAGATVVKNLQALNITKIDYLVGTHPHEDHIGGLDDVINSFEIGQIYMPKIQTNTKTFEDVLDAISNKNLTVTSPEVGTKFQVGTAQCEVMLCGTGTAEEKSNLNLSSIVIRTTYGEQSYLFTGDAESENESSRTWEQTNVLKVGHHGSSTSSSTNFLEQIKPQIAIIQVGTGNSYGHPTQTVLDRLNKLGTKIYRTDEDGNILITSDGIKNVVSTNVEL